MINTSTKLIQYLTPISLLVQITDEVKKLSEIFIFTLLCGGSKGFMKALKAFIKPFEPPQRSVKIKISLNFYYNTEMHGTGRVNPISDSNINGTKCGLF